MLPQPFEVRSCDLILGACDCDSKLRPQMAETLAKSLTGECARPPPRGLPRKRLGALRWLWWVLEILCSLVCSGVRFVVRPVRIVHGADVL